MTGYHYTSEANWLKIREQGLQPYKLKDELHAPQPGIWLFLNRQRGKSHTGCILFQLWTKQCFSVVELAVAYEHAWCKNRHEQEYAVCHDGHLSHYADTTRIWGHYHLNEPATIVWRPIPPEYIQCVGVYHFEQAWPQANDEIAVKILERATVRQL
jgi:hypothetical protein